LGREQMSLIANVFVPRDLFKSKEEEIQMSVAEIDWLWFSGSGNGYQTVEINMSPDLIVAQIWLHGGRCELCGHKALSSAPPHVAVPVR
jgi:hypothetical protein